MPGPSLTLFAHPFSSYSQKVLIALYENATPFTYRVLGPDDPDAIAQWQALWPIARFPVLVDGTRAVMEATSVIEYLHVAHRGAVPLIPADPLAALDVRTLDRVFDNYVMTPMQKIVLDHLRDPEKRDAHGVAEARTMLGKTYRWLEGTLAGRRWAAGDNFTLADCAAAPSLFYADWVQEIPEELANLRGYRARLLARPSFARAVDEARPYRVNFPPGAPDRD